MSKILDKIVETLNNRRVLYTIDGELITLHMSSLEGYIQLEKMDDDEDYTGLQTWVGQDDEQIRYNFHDDFKLDDIEGFVEGLIGDIKLTTKTISKITSLFESIAELMNEHNIGLSKLDELYYDCVDNIEEE
jgi:hypothetical protein